MIKFSKFFANALKVAAISMLVAAIPNFANAQPAPGFPVEGDDFPIYSPGKAEAIVKHLTPAEVADLPSDRLGQLARGLNALQIQALSPAQIGRIAFSLNPGEVKKASAHFTHAQLSALPPHWGALER